jgi:hypothetical protein
VHADEGLHECLFADCTCADGATNVVKLPMGDPPRRERPLVRRRSPRKEQRDEPIVVDGIELRHLTAIKGHAVLSVTLDQEIVDDRADYLRASGWAVEVR